MKASIFSNLLALMLVIGLTSCKDEKVYNWEHFQDEIISYQETKDYGLARGNKALYLYYGEMKLSGRNFLAGEAQSMTRGFHYPIVELLKKYPVLRNPKSVKSAAAQLLIIKRKNLEFYETINPGDLGSHG